MKSLFAIKFAMVFLMTFMAFGFVAACGDDDDDDDSNYDDDTTGDDDDDASGDDDATDDDDMSDDDDDMTSEASIRALHLSPNAGLVDIYVDNSLEFVLGLDFTQGTTYAGVPEGDYTINLIPTGGDPMNDSVFDIPVSLTGDTYYSAVVFGAIPDSKDGSGLQALLVVDDASDLDSNTFRVFVAHTADGVGEVDIWNIPEMGDPSILLEDVGYGETGFLTLPAGTYTVGFDADNDEVPDFIFELPTLSGGAQYNLFAVLDGDELFLIAQLPDGSTARIDPSV